ncbi:uncharacterized protein A1O5_06216 [Cladophialophora psammophila CBS 110553]|uniref:Uncharacterized protein n=1 Tax=Cladophialophora psammophila CBS 110553 TaxID=1182543 RepID=W9WQE6_9EURO|nr:uncharacterized protein A1O5_06216 [Cladophialophora psammophila CBS 110553]EXJ70148.1 hypothetical protein A1O5_06216 [Cladophialophora psammophila CBS 110553]
MLRIGGVLMCVGLHYGPAIYRLLGYSPSKQLLFPVVWLTVALIPFLITPLIIDRFPRNRLMGVGMICCSISLTVLVALIANSVPTTNHDEPRLP